MTFQMDIMGSSPLLVRKEEEERVKRSIEKNFESALHKAINKMELADSMKFYIQIEAENESADRIERRMGLRKYVDWKLLLTLVYDEDIISREKLVEVMHLAARLSAVEK